MYKCKFVRSNKDAKSLCVYLCKDLPWNKPTLVCFGQAKRCEVLTAWQPSHGPVQGQSRCGRHLSHECVFCENAILQQFGVQEITDDLKCQISNGEHAPDASKLEGVWGFRSLSSCFSTNGTKDKNGHWKGSIQPGGVYVHRLSDGVCCVGQINKERTKGADVWWEHNAFLGIPISSGFWTV